MSRILKNGAIAVPLKYLGNFWRSTNAKSNKIIFAIKDIKLFFPVIYQQEAMKNYQIFSNKILLQLLDYLF